MQSVKESSITNILLKLDYRKGVIVVGAAVIINIIFIITTIYNNNNIIIIIIINDLACETRTNTCQAMRIFPGLFTWAHCDIDAWAVAVPGTWPSIGGSRRQLTWRALPRGATLRDARWKVRHVAIIVGNQRLLNKERCGHCSIGPQRRHFNLRSFRNAAVCRAHKMRRPLIACHGVARY